MKVVLELNVLRFFRISGLFPVRRAREKHEGQAETCLADEEMKSASVEAHNRKKLQYRCDLRNGPNEGKVHCVAIS